MPLRPSSLDSRSSPARFCRWWRTKDPNWPSSGLSSGCSPCTHHQPPRSSTEPRWARSLGNQAGPQQLARCLQPPEPLAAQTARRRGPSDSPTCRLLRPSPAPPLLPQTAKAPGTQFAHGCCKRRWRSFRGSTTTRLRAAGRMRLHHTGHTRRRSSQSCQCPRHHSHTKGHPTSLRRHLPAGGHSLCSEAALTGCHWPRMFGWQHHTFHRRPCTCNRQSAQIGLFQIVVPVRPARIL